MKTRRNAKALRARIAELKKEWDGHYDLAAHQGASCWLESTVVEILKELSEL